MKTSMLKGMNPPPASTSAFHKRLHAWYAAHGRTTLPWRTTADPYRIYVSEVMLQQTRVETVRERYYGPFLKRFPTLSALAAAKREDVLKAWQGMGYYSRAANLHKAAQAAAPRLPDSVEGLLALPGVGRNTAQAVAAFAYREAVPVMEANVKRVLHRMFALTKANENALWEKAEALLDRANPFDYNQAMMDLGSMVCTRRNPRCGACPASSICKGKAKPEAYPAPKAKKKTPVRKRTIVLQRDVKGRIYAQPRTERFLHGMYRFTELEGKPPGGTHYLGHITQAYSHFTLEAEVYLLDCPQPRLGLEAGWFTLAQFKKLPHSKAEEKILALLEKNRRQGKSLQRISTAGS